MRKKRQAYTKEFKQEAVRLVQAGVRSATEVAASLNIEQSLPPKSVKSSELEGADAFRGHGKRTPWKKKSGD